MSTVSTRISLKGPNRLRALRSRLVTHSHRWPQGSRIRLVTYSSAGAINWSTSLVQNSGQVQPLDQGQARNMLLAHWAANRSVRRSF